MSNGKILYLIEQQFIPSENLIKKGLKALGIRDKKKHISSGVLYDINMNKVCEVLQISKIQESNIEAITQQISEFVQNNEIKSICKGNMRNTDIIDIIRKELGTNISFYDGSILLKSYQIKYVVDKLDSDAEIGIICDDALNVDDMICLSEFFNYITIYSNNADRIKEIEKNIFNYNCTLIKTTDSLINLMKTDTVLTFSFDVHYLNMIEKIFGEKLITIYNVTEYVKKTVLYDEHLNEFIPDISFEEAMFFLSNNNNSCNLLSLTEQIIENEPLLS